MGTKKSLKINKMLFVFLILFQFVTFLKASEIELCPKPEYYFNETQRMNFAIYLEEKYPNLVKRFSIGESQGGRLIHGVEISDNPGISEKLEPEVKFVANIHGDEVVGNHLTLSFACHLLTNYENDSIIKNFVDNTRIFLLFSFNPDGFAKFQRYTLDNRDLNRDFPDQFKKDNDDCQNRGKETCLMMNWLKQRHFILSAHFHGGALVVSYGLDGRPDLSLYKYNYVEAPDDNFIKYVSTIYADSNPSIKNSLEFKSSNGITNGAQWYPIYGGVQDYNYFWHDCIDVTIEVSEIKFAPVNYLKQAWNDNKDSMLKFMLEVHRGVKGVVVDEEGNALTNVAVSVDSIQKPIYTRGEFGSFFRLLLPGTYKLSFYLNGYESVEKTITIPESTKLLTLKDSIVMKKGISGSKPVLSSSYSSSSQSTITKTEMVESKTDSTTTSKSFTTINSKVPATFSITPSSSNASFEKPFICLILLFILLSRL